MRERHSKEQREATLKLDRELRDEEEGKGKAWEQEREKMMHEKRNKQAAEITSRPDLSKDELEAVSSVQISTCEP